MSNRPETTVTKNRMNNFIYITLFAVNVYNSSKTIQFYVHKNSKTCVLTLANTVRKSNFLRLFGLFLWGPPIKLLWDLWPLDILSLLPVCIPPQQWVLVSWFPTKCLILYSLTKNKKSWFRWVKQCIEFPVITLHDIIGTLVSKSYRHWIYIYKFFWNNQ
jgi:hypothetical protein